MTAAVPDTSGKIAAISKQTLVEFLRSRNRASGLLQKLKMVYRPLICPFDDLLALVAPGSRVFDIGCGQGQFVLLLAEFRKPNALGGVEISPALVLSCKQLLDEYASSIALDFRVYDGTHLPATIADYDTVFMVDVLHHVPRDAQAAFLVALQRVMSPGSRLIIKDIDGASPLVFANKLHDLALAGEIGHELSLQKAIQYASDAGFSVGQTTRRRMLWYPHYTLVLTRTPD